MIDDSRADTRMPARRVGPQQTLLARAVCTCNWHCTREHDATGEINAFTISTPSIHTLQAILFVPRSTCDESDNKGRRTAGTRSRGGRCTIKTSARATSTRNGLRRPGLHPLWLRKIHVQNARTSVSSRMINEHARRRSWTKHANM
jgi:hypothetical protein